MNVGKAPSKIYRILGENQTNNTNLFEEGEYKISKIYLCIHIIVKS